MLLTAVTATTGLSRTAALRRAVVRATRAPSVHNTQPWTFRLRHDVLSIDADRSRQLHALDPGARQLMISCGCALLNVRVSLAASEFSVAVDRFPDPARRDLVARVVPTDRGAAAVDALAAFDPIIDRRRTNRRRFTDEEVPADVLDGLVSIALAHGVELFVVDRKEHREVAVRLSRRADAIENADPAYRAEVRAWTGVDPSRADGVPPLAVPNVDGTEQDELWLRDFDALGTGCLPFRTSASPSQCLVVLGTAEDRPIDWLRTGEALEHILLAITEHGFVAGPLTQAVEVPLTRKSLQYELGLAMYPHLLLRIGRAPLTPASRRRRLVDVLVEDA